MEPRFSLPRCAICGLRGLRRFPQEAPLGFVAPISRQLSPVVLSCAALPKVQRQFPDGVGARVLHFFVPNALNGPEWNSAFLGDNPPFGMGAAG